MKNDAAVAGLSSGQVPYSVTLSTALEAAAKGIPLRLLMAVDKENFDLVMQPGLHSAQDVRGEAIGVTVLNRNLYFAAKAILEHEGLSSKDVRAGSFRWPTVPRFTRRSRAARSRQACSGRLRTWWPRKRVFQS